MELNVGTLAATKQTWRDKTVRELFAEVKSRHPSVAESTLRRHFRDAVREDDDYFLAVVDYAFDAAARALRVAEERQQYARHITADEKAVRAATSAERAAEHAKAVSFVKEQIILLNQEMPNGKRARYCTLDYFWRLGGAYRHVGKRGNQKLVGAQYSEEQYRSKLKGLT